MKVRILLLLALLLSGCAAPPKEISERAVDRNAVERHQTTLQQLNDWTLRGQIALFNLRDDERDAVYLEWQHSTTRTHMRFYHPLKGTLARLEQDASGATYVAADGQAFYGQTAEQLVTRLFGYQLPLELLTQVIIGRQPPGAQQLRYQLHPMEPHQVAALSSYSVARQAQTWQVNLTAYQPTQHLLLPHQVELTSAAWRIKVKVKQWKL